MTETIRPKDLPQALSRAGDAIQVLSLDCFDTLLWRDCHAPTDVFSSLTHVLPQQRIASEKHARKAEATLRQSTEIGLQQIYDHALPNADNATKAAAIEAELKAEAQHCFAFEPTVALMREAKARGLKVIIVSDTYLREDQLRQLIQSAAGEDVTQLIDHIFASCDAGVSKSQGLLAKVISKLKHRPDQILHIGDNKTADYDSARALGIPTLHLLQFADATKTQLRLERACARLAYEGKAIASSAEPSGLQMHRATMAREMPVIDDPAEALGFATFGPAFFAFDQWLREEAGALEKERGGTVHWLFMLRDGHLPQLVHAANGKVKSTAGVEISRFVATAASLASPQAYKTHMALEHGLNPPTLARQFLFTEDEISALGIHPNAEQDRIQLSRDLLKELRKGQRQKLTRRRARALATRLIEHIRQAVDPKPGDTLMLVDLGYNGSAQNRIDDLISEALDVHVAGRYLIMREMQASGLDKKGMIDTRCFNPYFVEALCSNVAVIEQLATCELGSVMDYSDAGDPIRKPIGVKGAQSHVRDAVQKGVVRFARSALHAAQIRRTDYHNLEGWRQTAVAALSRFMFLPQPTELAVLKGFEHDVNLGSDRMVPLFDPAHAREGMRRRGLFYMKGSSRMFLPAELAEEDINTRLSLMVQKSFGLALTYEDGASQKLTFPVYYISANGDTRIEIDAYATHDGYYAARIPFGRSASGIAFQIGAHYEWAELVSVTQSPVNSLVDGEHNVASPVMVKWQSDGAVEHASGIIECPKPTALIFMAPNQRLRGDEAHMLEIVFRPIRMRKTISSSFFNSQTNPQGAAA